MTWTLGEETAGSAWIVGSGTSRSMLGPGSVSLWLNTNSRTTAVIGIARKLRCDMGSLQGQGLGDR